MLKLKLQYFGHLMWRDGSLEKTLMLGGIEGRRRRDDRRWDGWMASPTRWTWVWVNSGSWWWTGRPGVLWFMGSPRVGHDWATELNWTELIGLTVGTQDRFLGRSMTLMRRWFQEGQADVMWWKGFRPAWTWSPQFPTASRGPPPPPWPLCSEGQGWTTYLMALLLLCSLPLSSPSRSLPDTLLDTALGKNAFLLTILPGFSFVRQVKILFKLCTFYALVKQPAVPWLRRSSLYSSLVIFLPDPSPPSRTSSSAVEFSPIYQGLFLLLAFGVLSENLDLSWWIFEFLL